MSAVILQQLSKVYPNGVIALRDLDLSVSEGELLVLVGPSGCGKTTTLRLIAGLETPSHGSILLHGKVVDPLPPRERDVALVFQRATLYPHLTIRRNLEFGFRLRNPVGLRERLRAWCAPSSRSAIRNRHAQLAEQVDRAAEMLQLKALLDRFPHQLSGGQQQRAALGRALVRQARILLLDEPLSQLDAGLRAEMRRELHLLHRRLHATMIYVTHDPVEAMTLGDRIAVLDGGVLQQVGRPPELVHQPRNRMVAGFIGWPPMSFVSGTIVRSENDFAFMNEACSLPLAVTNGLNEKAHLGRTLILGIRPGAVRLAAGLGNTITMDVVRLEELGGIRLMTLRRGNWEIVGHVSEHEVIAEGQRVETNWDMRRAYWFDPSNGLTLAGGCPAG
jgi:multiple sugar transport system ATP-binding protein